MRLRLPRRLLFIALYMALIFAVIITLIHYAKDHPLQDVRVNAAPAG